MAISQFTKPAELTPLNFDFLLKTKELADAKKEKTLDEFDTLSSKLGAVNALPQDISIRNQKLNEYDQKLHSWYDKYKDNLTVGVPELRNLKNAFNQDVTRGQLGAIASNYAARKAHEEEVNKAYTAGNINQQRRDALLAADLYDYSGVGPENATGSYNFYKGSTPAKEVDLADKAVKLAEGWKADKIERGGYHQDKNGLYFINSVGSKEYADPSEIKTYVSTALQQDPTVRSFIDQETKLHNIGVNENTELYSTDPKGNPVQVNPLKYLEHYKNSFIDDAANLAAAKYGYTQVSSKDEGLSWVPDYVNKVNEEPKYQTSNLNSVQIPQTEGIKVINPMISSRSRALTEKEAQDVYKNYGLLNPDGSLKSVMGSSYELAKAEIDAGKPEAKENVKIDFNSNQKAILNRAVKEGFASMPTNDVDKAELINNYVDSFNSNLVFPGLIEYNWADKKTSDLAQRETEMFFGDKGPKLFNARNYKLIAGEGPKKLTGPEFSEKFSNDANYTKSVTGKLSPDNPYYTNGRIVTVTDKNGNILRYAMSGSNEEMASPVTKVLHDMYLAKYNPSGISEVYIPIKEGNKTINKKFTVEYSKNKNGTENVSINDNSGNIHNVSVNVNSGQDPFITLFNQFAQ